MADPAEPVIQTCSACGALVDVSDEAPFDLVHCPGCGAAQRVRRDFEQFELQEMLGAGGMGAVYRAIDTQLNRQVALKLLRKEYSANPDFVARFEQEASITASINHPHVVKVYTAGNDRGLLYIAMELVDKGSLDDLMNLQGRVAESQVLDVGIQIAQGLNAALQRGLIHRDVKPGNILFADAHTAKIVDFGLASLQEQSGSVGGEVWGTPYYVAPEKLESPPVEDYRSDIYSLGASLFHAIAGRPPFEAETASMVALKHLKSQVVSIQSFAPDVSSPTAYVINMALEKEPDNRFQDYEEMIKYLEYARSELLEAVAQGPAKKSRVVLGGEEEQRALGWITFAIVAIVVLGGLFFFAQDWFTESPAEADAKAQAASATPAIEVMLKEARGQMTAGMPEEALSTLRQLSSTPENLMPQPLLNWIILHEGTGELLAGREAKAREVFARMRGDYSHDPSEEKLADFFEQLSRQLVRPTAVPASVATKYQKTNYEAIALFLFALKNWHLAKFDEAGPLFRQFKSSKPEAPYEWMSDFQKVSDVYVQEYSEFQAAQGLLKSSTPGKRKTAIESARAALEKMDPASKFRPILEAQIKAAEAKLASQELEDARKEAEAMKADAGALEKVRARVATRCRELNYAGALSAANAASVASAGGKREKEVLVKKLDALAKFKALLVQDLSASRYAQPITKRNGQVVPGEVRRATPQMLEVGTQFGSAEIPWPEVSPETLSQMAKSLLRADLPPDRLADRQWYCGMFAFAAAGQKLEGRAMLSEAAQRKASYRDLLPLILESPELL